MTRVQLTPGSKASTVEHEYANLVATSKIKNANGQLLVYVVPTIEADAQRAIRPEATAFGVFGFIALLAALLIAVEAISRSLGRGAAETEVLRALGAGPRITSTDGLLGAFGAVLIGTSFAVALAIGFSPHTLFGPVRAGRSPLPGVDLDWAVLGLGAVGHRHGARMHRRDSCVSSGPAPRCRAVVSDIVKAASPARQRRPGCRPRR